ncbi:hypothetical protein [Neptuniibacter sp. CAU 1671]|uniref:hypothetical protein n=1 Tax=Neptuniibacter sp. CAU 1671 TaxID=3032593 RepID=UPI0023D991A0|nr:hypothetical protein [Neptuniibacter sp. CAU 1671]MDF2180635.1 hypothetical protein [Neptuniibacter sp. CAU 1671]
MEKILKGRFGGYKIKVNGVEEVFKGAKYGDFFMKEEYVGKCFNIKYYDFMGDKNIIKISGFKEESNGN